MAVGDAIDGVPLWKVLSIESTARKNGYGVSRRLMPNGKYMVFKTK